MRTLDRTTRTTRTTRPAGPRAGRRTFLGLGAGLGVGLGTALVAGCDAGDPSPAAASPSPTGTDTVTGTGSPTGDATALVLPEVDPADWESVRAQFPLDPALVQMAAFVLSPHTAQVDAAVAHHRQRLARDTATALLEGEGLEEEVRRAAAAFAGGEADQYALTDSTTTGLAHLYGGLSLAAGDEVLTTTHDFYSTEESLALLTARTGASLRRVTLYDDPAAATVDEMTTRLLAGVGPRTRAVATTWVHSGTGVRVPVREVADALAEVNRRRDPADRVLLCVDGVHGFAVVDTALPDLGCDFLATGTHKWLFGPRGTGILWARDWAPLTPLVPTFSGPGGAAAHTPGGYHDFEHRWAAATAFDLARRIGRERIAARTAEQATRLKEGLAAIDGVRLVTPLDPEVSAGIVCLEVTGLTPGDGVYRLREQGVVASATPYAQSYLRLGPSIVTTPEQVDATVEAVGALV